jgi:hypothetical protein
MMLSNACTIAMTIPRKTIATGTNADCYQDRQQQGNASRSRVAGETVAAAGTK